MPSPLSLSFFCGLAMVGISSELGQTNKFASGSAQHRLGGDGGSAKTLPTLDLPDDLKKSLTTRSRTRVDSFEFFFASRNTKLYETDHCFAEFRSFSETEKIRKYEKSVSSCFAKLKKSFRFVVSHISI